MMQWATLAAVLSCASALNIGTALPLRAARACVVAVAEPPMQAATETAGMVVPSGVAPPAEGLETPEALAARSNDASKLLSTVRRAEFWSNESATFIEVLNVVGRWRTHGDFAVRTEFETEVGYRDEDERQAGTQKRYEMAQRMKCVERVALQQNAPKQPFVDDALAASVGLSAEDFNRLPVSKAACNIVYDALAESKSSLVPYDTCDARREGWSSADGALNELNFRTGLYKARALVVFSWFLFGKGNFVWVLLAVQFLHDWRPDLFPTPKELNLDKIGAFI